jgi:hypothetical protein
MSQDVLTRETNRRQLQQIVANGFLAVLIVGKS